ncbi:MAG: ribonuclease R [Saprospiraceae bacterium]|nr:ribonuclease R [Saprospiraceae bacterium]
MSKKNRIPKQRKLTAGNLQIEILKYLLSNPRKRLTVGQLIESLRVDNNKDSVSHAVNRLLEAGSLAVFPGDKYGVALARLTGPEVEMESEAPAARPARTPVARRQEPTDERPHRIKRAVDKFITGWVDMTRTGAAYVVTDDMDSDIYVAPKYVNSAMHGDTVRVLLFPVQPRRRQVHGRKPEGEIVEVLKRNNEHFLGRLSIGRKYALCVVDSQYVHTDVYIPLDAIGDARDGDSVVVHITDWQEGKGRIPIGKVTQALGRVGGSDFEMKKILINAGFELQASDEALAEAAAIPEGVPAQEVERRRDFRDVLTFTIDPEDARDFDDALSIRKLDNGNIEVGIHIADVAYYLKPGSHMDQEAFKRSTSVYLVDRVCPMLPEKLSNNLCSLVPEQERLTFSVVVEFDDKDNIVKRWFGRTVIFSDKRFAYEEAQTVIENNPAEHLVGHPLLEQLRWGLLELNRLSKKMRKAREKNGAISFESEEVRFRLAPDGTPIEAYVKERKDAHLLIEDFMLLANKEVAFYIDQMGQAQQEVPFVYRVHDLPDQEKVADFSRFAFELGYPMKVDTPKQIATSFNTLLKAAQKDERLKPLMPLAIRTMAKAVYSTNNIGHYGLGFSHYAHFTSPIRRYSDVLAHRILERNLDGRTWRADKEKLEEQCKHISSQERKAADAERESIRYKQAEYLSSRVGQVFTGVVNGFIDRGFFVELADTKAEGLVDFKYLDDTYVLDPGNLRARGRRYGKIIQIGDRVAVRIAAVDLQKRQVDMEWTE